MIPTLGEVILALLRAGEQIVTDVQSGKLSTSDALARIEGMNASVAANNAAADDELDKRFPQ